MNGLHTIIISHMRTTFNVCFYARKSKANRQGLAPIECSVIMNGERALFNLPMKCSPVDFAKKRKPKELEEFLSITRTKVYEVVNQMMLAGIPVTAENIRRYMKTGGVQSYTIRNLFNDYMSILSKRVDVDMTLPVYKRYENIKDKFLAFVNPDDEVAALTHDVIKTFVTELYRNYDDSTAAGMATRLKTFIKYGMSTGKIKNDPWYGIKLTKGWKPIEMLSDKDFESICNKPIEIERLRRVRDMFVFACGSGLAWIDMKELKPEDFQTIDGKLCIVKPRHKTNNTFVSVLLPWAVEVAQKYNYNIGINVISNQKMNSYCTELKDICGVTSVRSLHTHLGRHFYANKLLNLGVRPETVAKACGHSNYKVLMKHYAQIQETTTVKEISKVL